MTKKTLHTIHILVAFLVLAIMHFICVIVNAFLQDETLGVLLVASGLVINVTGILIGVFNIYQSLQLRKHTNIWVLFFTIGVICILFNAYALSL